MSDYVYGLNKSGLSVIKLLYNQKKIFDCWDDNIKIRPFCCVQLQVSIVWTHLSLFDALAMNSTIVIWVNWKVKELGDLFL